MSLVKIGNGYVNTENISIALCSLFATLWVMEMINGRHIKEWFC